MEVQRNPHSQTCSYYLKAVSLLQRPIENLVEHL